MTSLEATRYAHQRIGLLLLLQNGSRSIVGLRVQLVLKLPKLDVMAMAYTYSLVLSTRCITTVAVSKLHELQRGGPLTEGSPSSCYRHARVRRTS